jgi:hypothetical protein
MTPLDRLAKWGEPARQQTQLAQSEQLDQKSPVEARAEQLKPL